MTTVKIVTTKEYIEEHGAIPIHGQCQECNEYCSVHTDVADILYISISKGLGYNGIVYFPRTWETTHISYCIDHAPSEKKLKEARETIPGFSSLFFEGTSYYIIGDVPVWGWTMGLVPKGEVIRWEQPKFKRVPGQGTQLGKRRAIRALIPGPVRTIVRHEVGRIEVLNKNLPDRLLLHIVKLQPENYYVTNDVEVDSP